MKTKIDPGNPIPMYYQLRDIIVEGIDEGRWGIGDMIPPESQLCKTFDVSRNTAQKAIEQLVHEGILTRRQGVGTFVTTPRIEQGLCHFYSFSEAISARGDTHHSKVLGITVEKASEKQVRTFGIEEGESVVVLTRVRYVNGSPFVLETSCIPEKLAPGLQEIDFEVESLYKTLTDKYHIYVSRAREKFEPVLINEFESKWLNVEKGSPALLLERIASNAKDEPIEYCRSIIPGSKCCFYTELR